MALETIASNFGEAGAKLSGKGPGTLKNILTELQNVKIGLAAGAASNADITMTGMLATDTVMSVCNITDVTNLDASDFTPKADAITNGSTTNLTGKTLLVQWASKG